MFTIIEVDDGSSVILYKYIKRGDYYDVFKFDNGWIYLNYTTKDSFRQTKEINNYYVWTVNNGHIEE